jgi:hypothetical protein
MILLSDLKKPIDPEIRLKVNDYNDLTVDKLLVFFERVEPRDAIDLFYILKTVDFWKLTELAKQKDPGFDLYRLEIALHKVKEYPDNIEDLPVEMIKEINIQELKNLFLNLSKKIMDKIKKDIKNKKSNILHIYQIFLSVSPPIIISYGHKYKFFLF